MPFYPPSWVPKLPFEPPSDISIPDFILSDRYGRHPIAKSRPFFTCGLSGKTYSAVQARERVEHLALGLGQEFGWAPNEGTEWDKVVAVFSLNTVCPLRSLEPATDLCQPTSSIYPRLTVETAIS